MSHDTDDQLVSRPTSLDAVDRDAGEKREIQVSRVDTYQTLAASLLKAAQLVTAELNAELRPYGLSMPRFEALMFIRQRADGVLLSKISSALGVHPSSVTGLVDRLEADRMAVRSPHDHDRRATLVLITPKGADLADRAARALSDAQFGLRGLAVEEAITMTAMLDLLRDSYDDGQSGR